MSGNVNLTPDMITKDTLMVLHNNLHFSKNVNKQYDDQFAIDGAKIGSTLRVRKPIKFKVTTGPGLQIQDAVGTYTSLVITNQDHVDFQFTTAELTLSIDEFRERYIVPAAAVLSSTIDRNGLALYYKVWNETGTPGTAIGGSQVLLNGGAILDKNSVPRDGNRHCVLNPDDSASIVEGLKGLFNPQIKISEQYTEGLLGENILGLRTIGTDQNVATHTAGTRTATGTYTVSSFNPATPNQIVLSCGAGENGKTIKKGDTFAIDACYMVNAESKNPTSTKVMVTVSADVTVSSTTPTVTFEPALISSNTDPYQNVTNDPTGGAAVTFTAAAGKVYSSNLIYHKDAFTLATADLVMPNNVDFSARENYDGISLRIVRQYDINNDNLPCRTDVLYGWLCQRPEMAVRAAGQ